MGLLKYKTIKKFKKSAEPSGGNPVKKKKTPVKKKPSSDTAVNGIPGKKTKMPISLKPMLAVLVDKPFDGEGWLYEVKWDGYRALSFLQKQKVDIKSRNNKLFNEKFYPVTRALQELNLNAVIDGEIVTVDEKGISDFGALQNWRSEADGELYYYIFDLLWINGHDLVELPLTERKKLLESVIPETGIIKLSKSFKSSGIEFFESAKKLGLEGIIAKKSESRYQSGIRSWDWLKIKAGKRQEVVIGGYTKNDDSNKLFSSLLVGVFENKELKYIGKIGTGFNNQVQNDIMKQLKPLIVKKTPFKEIPDVNKPSRFRPDPPHAKATWLKPKLVCEVSFTEMTRDGVMRHPSFEGMRVDKNANTVVMEKAEPIKKSRKIPKDLNIQAPDNKSRKSLLNVSEDTQVRKINGHEIKFTNLGKLYWPKDKITKRDMLNYYYQMAPYILPYLKNRPQSMNRHPNG
ncbi:MAG TPA: non-homologous end-joining DNA ligase, partial [Chitinophagaceae bacterium]